MIFFLLYKGLKDSIAMHVHNSWRAFAVKSCFPSFILSVGILMTEDKHCRQCASYNVAFGRAVFFPLCCGQSQKQYCLPIHLYLK